MVITFSASQASNGLRRIDPNKDLPQLVDLLHLVFGPEMDNNDRLFGSILDNQSPSFLWRFDPSLARLSPGYVLEVDKKIIGNVTLIPARPNGRFLVANVAVHPDYRRQGFARLLMNAAIQDVRDRRGSEIFLQVVSENQMAINLYKSLGFYRLGDMTTWQTSVSRVRPLPENNQRITVRSLPGRRWKEAYQLDCKALDPNLIWPEPQRSDYYKIGIWHKFIGFMNGYQKQTFVTLEKDGQLSGLINVQSEWGRPHEIMVRVHPERRGQLESALLNRAIKSVRNLARRNIRLIQNADDVTLNQLLPAANFSPQRTLTHMRLKVT